MGPFMEAVKKYGVYFILAGAIAFNLGAAVGAWTPDDATWMQVDVILGFLGLGSVRAQLSTVFAGVDLGPVGIFLQSYRTYIAAILGAAFGILTAFHVIVPGTPIMIFINALLGALGLGTYALAMKTYKTEALKAVRLGEKSPFIKRISETKP